METVEALMWFTVDGFVAGAIVAVLYRPRRKR